VQVDAEVEAEAQPFFSVNLVSLVSISFIFIFKKFYFLYLYCFSVLFFEKFFSFVLMSLRTCFSFMLSFDLFRRLAYCGILYAYFFLSCVCFFLSRGVVLGCLDEPRDYRCCFFVCFVPSSFLAHLDPFVLYEIHLGLLVLCIFALVKSRRCYDLCWFDLLCCSVFNLSIFDQFLVVRFLVVIYQSFI